MLHKTLLVLAVIAVPASATASEDIYDETLYTPGENYKTDPQFVDEDVDGEILIENNSPYPIASLHLDGVEQLQAYVPILPGQTLSVPASRSAYHDVSAVYSTPAGNWYYLNGYTAFIYEPLWSEKYENVVVSTSLAFDGWNLGQAMTGCRSTGQLLSTHTYHSTAVSALTGNWFDSWFQVDGKGGFRWQYQEVDLFFRVIPESQLDISGSYVETSLTPHNLARNFDVTLSNGVTTGLTFLEYEYAIVANIDGQFIPHSSLDCP